MSAIIDQVKWWFAEETFNNRHKMFTVTKGEPCDWCSGEMKYAGANFKTDVKRACGFHLNAAKSYLRKQRLEYGLEATPEEGKENK